MVTTGVVHQGSSCIEQEKAVVGSSLTLVLFGQLGHYQHAHLRPFWSGFIELQKRLPADKIVGQIVAHSWNPDLAGLARFVYAPIIEHHEHQGGIYPESVHLFEAVVQCKKKANSATPDSNEESIQSVLTHARSRARAIRLLEEAPTKEGQVLMASWDLGREGSDTQVAHLVFDAALPEEYLYLPYSSEMDVGYADAWLQAPWQIARLFAHFDTFALDALSGHNHYLECFSKTGWPRARVKSRIENLFLHPYVQKYRVIFSRLTRGIQDRSKGNFLSQRILRRLTTPLQRFLDRPLVTAENSCVPGFEKNLPVFPECQALSTQALLKYFILTEGLRDEARFLADDDFELKNQSGQLINPQPIVLIVQDANDAAIVRLQLESPMPLAAIYQMANGLVHEHLLNESGDWATTTLQPISVAPRDMMACALHAAEKLPADSLPVLVAPTVGRYFGCTDWFYLNALMKHIVWSDLAYVGLECSCSGRPLVEFPDLHMVQGCDAFAMRMAAGTVAGIRKLVNVADSELVDFCNRTNGMQPEFHAVVRDVNLF